MIKSVCRHLLFLFCIQSCVGYKSSLCSSILSVNVFTADSKMQSWQADLAATMDGGGYMSPSFSSKQQDLSWLSTYKSLCDQLDSQNSEPWSQCWGSRYSVCCVLMVSDYVVGVSGIVCGIRSTCQVIERLTYLYQ